MERKPKKSVHIHPAPPTALTQEIPTPDVVHTFEVPPRAFTGDGIVSDVLGSYTGVPVDGDKPVQDADDL